MNKTGYLTLSSSGKKKKLYDLIGKNNFPKNYLKKRATSLILPLSILFDSLFFPTQ